MTQCITFDAVLNPKNDASFGGLTDPRTDPPDSILTPSGAQESANGWADETRFSGFPKPPTH